MAGSQVHCGQHILYHRRESERAAAEWEDVSVEDRERKRCCVGRNRGWEPLPDTLLLQTGSEIFKSLEFHLETFLLPPPRTSSVSLARPTPRLFSFFLNLHFKYGIKAPQCLFTSLASGHKALALVIRD